MMIICKDTVKTAFRALKMRRSPNRPRSLFRRAPGGDGGKTSAMKEDPMKKMVCVTLSLLLAVWLCGCGKLPAGTKENLKMIADRVESTGDMIERTQAVIDWQIDGSVAQMEAAQAARDSGQVYVAEDNIEDVRAKYQELTGLHDELLAMKAEVDALPDETGVRQLDDTYAAAKTYFAEMNAAYEDLLAVFDFYFAAYEALTPIREFDGSAYSSFTQMEIMWNNVQQASADMKSVSCPEFMEQTWEKYIKQVEHYVALIQTLYTAAALSDPLRYAAVGNMSVRADEQLYRCGNELTEDYNLQFGRVKERLTGRLGVLKSELLSNCGLLLDAA